MALLSFTIVRISLPNSKKEEKIHIYLLCKYVVCPLVEPFVFCRFESSSHAISMSAYLREQRRELYSKSGELQGEERDGWMNWAEGADSLIQTRDRSKGKSKPLNLQLVSVTLWSTFSWNSLLPLSPQREGSLGISTNLFWVIALVLWWKHFYTDWWGGALTVDWWVWKWWVMCYSFSSNMFSA